MSRLVIVQEYVPEYRIGFFDRLVTDLAAKGVECVVAAGTPVGAQSARADARTAPWVTSVNTRVLHLGSRALSLGGTHSAWTDADAVIVGQLGSSLDTYRALLESKRRGRPVGLWGHIKAYIAPPHPVDRALERWQLRRADEVFAYTPSGAAYAADAGVEPDRLTVVMNTIDTAALEAARASLTSQAIRDFGVEYGLTEGKVLGFFGGLDGDKRIGFLARTLDELWVSRSDVRVLLGGRGRDRDLLADAVARDQVIDLGYIGDREKALVGAWASALLSPGRIGLVAVEALALGLPVITTSWPFHAPEVEYLVEGVSRLTAPDEPTAFARFVAARLSAPFSAVSGPYPTITAMVDNFATGAIRLLGRSPERGSV